MWKPLLFALAVGSWAGCSIEADFAATQFRCDEVPRCPSGQMCVNGVCLLFDGGVADAMPPDPLLAAWQPTSSISPPRASNLKHAAVAGGFIYMVGGVSATLDGKNGINEIDSVIMAPIQDDGTLGGWIDTFSLPAPRALGDVVVHGADLYVIGGTYEGQATETVYRGRQDSSMGDISWELTTPLPVPLHGHVSVTDGLRIYTIGGADGSNVRYASVYIAEIQQDGSLGSWQTGPPLPAARSNHAAVLTSEGIYVVGGENEFQLVEARVDFARFNAGNQLDGWTATTPLPQWRPHATAFVAADHLYVVGGGGDTVTAQVLHAPIQADDMLGSWQENTALPMPVWQHAMAVSDTHVYTLGGDGAAGMSAAVYFTTLPRGTEGMQ